MWIHLARDCILWIGVNNQAVLTLVIISRTTVLLLNFMFYWPCILVQFVLITNLTHFFDVFISLLYMFRATQRSSSGESIVSTHHLVYITLCKWPSGMLVRESDIYRMMYWYNWFSWWWVLGCLKHVEKWKKAHQKSASSWLLTQLLTSSYWFPPSILSLPRRLSLKLYW